MVHLQAKVLQGFGGDPKAFAFGTPLHDFAMKGFEGGHTFSVADLMLSCAPPLTCRYTLGAVGFCATMRKVSR